MRAQRVTLTAVCIAIVTVMVLVVKVPIAATGGYTHPGAVAEIFIAIAFGPVVGGVAAGVGAALADLFGGYGNYAPLTLVAHGALGLIAGRIAWRKPWPWWIAGWVAGGLALVIVYFVGQATVYGLGAATAAVEAPINLFQVALGGLGLVLFQLVKRAYPPIEHLGEAPPFTAH